MATRQLTRNIALTPHLDKLVRSKVASGRYQSASEVVREGLRLLEQADQSREAGLQGLCHDIEAAWQQSNRGDVINGPTVFNEIRALSKSRRSKSKKPR